MIHQQRRPDQQQLPATVGLQALLYQATAVTVVISNDNANVMTTSVVSNTKTSRNFIMHSEQFTLLPSKRVTRNEEKTLDQYRVVVKHSPTIL